MRRGFDRETAWLESSTSIFAARLGDGHIIIEKVIVNISTFTFRSSMFPRKYRHGKSSSSLFHSSLRDFATLKIIVIIKLLWRCNLSQLQSLLEVPVIFKEPSRLFDNCGADIPNFDKETPTSVVSQAFHLLLF